MAILMIQPWQKVARQKITKIFSPDPEISFPPLGEEDGTEGPMIIEAEIGGHFIHRIHHTPHWFQWRSHMANGADIASSENRGCRTLSFHIDEFHGSKVTISVQRNYRKARCEENSSSPINGSQNAKISGPRRSTYSTEQQDNPIGIHDGLRTGSSTLTEEERKALCDLLRRNLDIFAWKPEGMFLGYKVNTKGIQVCSDKVEAVINLQSPKCLKDVQKLNGKLASLNRFLFESAEKSLPFFKTLKKCTKKSDFQWTAEAEAAFKQMKQLIAEPPTLTTTMEKEELIVHLVAAQKAVSAVLITEREAKQMPVYFVSRALQGPEINYKPEVARRLQKRSIELGEYDIQYRPRTSVKGQILAYFIVERLEDDSPNTPMETDKELPDPWTLFMDGSSCVDGSRAGLILTDPWSKDCKTNGVKNLQASVDSCLVANQVPRSENKKADAVGKIASTSFAHLTKQVPVEELNEKSINVAEVLAVVEEVGDTWMTPIYNYLMEETLPAETEKARAIRRKSGWYDVVNGILQHARRNKIRGSKGNTNRILLAHNARECKKIDLGMSGLPGELISDNGKQFRHNPFKDWCEKLCILQRFGSVKHPQANGLVERANRRLGEGIKARLDKKIKYWIEDVPHVLWAHRTMIKSSNRDTPFSLTYGTEAVIPAKIGMPTFRTAEIDMVQNDESLEINLDLLEERREQVAICEARSKAKMEKYYNSKVRNTSFRPGDLVYQNNDSSHAKDSGKLSPKWEGPYEVTEALGNGAYKLRDRNGKHLLRTWNVCNLKKCY
ncbi:reverse transcriptase domain-containing protein [Tanacetum coccineum]